MVNNILNIHKSIDFFFYAYLVYNFFNVKFGKSLLVLIHVSHNLRSKCLPDSISKHMKHSESK